jgi:hypothetical protein
MECRFTCLEIYRTAYFIFKFEFPVHSYRWPECEGRICGLLLKSIVLGPDCLSSRRLILQAENINLEFIRILAHLVSPTLRNFKLFSNSLSLDDNGGKMLEIFLARCHEINQLDLDHFKFTSEGPENSAIKDGFARLREFLANLHPLSE